MTYTPKPPRRVILAARVEPQVKEWLEKQFPNSISHGVNHILAEYMATSALRHHHGIEQEVTA